MFHRATRLFCDVYNPQSKTYCKRLQVLCPEHSRDPKVSGNSVHKTSGMFPSHTWRGFTLFSFVWWLDPGGRGVRVSSGEERVWADRRLLQGLQKEMQQTLQLGKAQESRGGLGASQSGKSTFVIVALFFYSISWEFCRFLNGNIIASSVQSDRGESFFLSLTWTYICS